VDLTISTADCRDISTWNPPSFRLSTYFAVESTLVSPVNKRPKDDTTTPPRKTDEKLRVIDKNKQRLASKTEQNRLRSGWRGKVRCAVKKEMLQDAKPKPALNKENKRMIGERLFRGKASIYALDEVSKEWVDRGISGQLIMFQNQQFRTDIRIKWSNGEGRRDGNQRMIWWRLMNGKMKPKGERAWVLKAWDTQTNKQEILAIRFSDAQLSQQFSVKFHQIFPAQPPPQSATKILTQHKEQMSLAAKGIFNVGASVSDRKGTGSGVNSLGV